MLAVVMIGTAQSAVTVNLSEAALRKGLITGAMLNSGYSIAGETEHTLSFNYVKAGGQTGTMTIQFMFVPSGDNATLVQVTVSYRGYIPGGSLTKAQQQQLNDMAAQWEDRIVVAANKIISSGLNKP